MFRKIFLVTLTTLAGAVAFAQNQYKVMAIGFYNCENFYYPSHDPNKNDEEFTPDGTYHYTEAIYKQKLHNIATVMAKMGTDVTPDGPAIIGVGEVENDFVLKGLTEQPELSPRHYKYVWFYTPDEKGLSTAMLYNPRYLTILFSEPLHVPTETLPQKKHTRDILYIYGVLAGDTVHLLINDWPSKTRVEPGNAAGRLLAASVVKRVTDSLLKINPDTKVLVLGGLNDDPKSDAVKVLDATTDKERTDLTDMYNPWASMYKKDSGTESYMGESRLTDQIIVSGAFLKDNNNKWKYFKAEIYDRDFLVNKSGHYEGLLHRSFTMAHVWDNGYSDHFPVLVYLIEKKNQ